MIGNDGTPPAAFRVLAREQISAYNSVTMMNGSVKSIVPEGNGTSFMATDKDGQQYRSRKVILGTGMRDILSSTPGLAAAWAKGIYC